MRKRFANGGIITPEDSRREPAVQFYKEAEWKRVLVDRVTPTRLCKVDGKPAFFHRFVESDKGVLQINAFCKPRDVETVLENFNNNNFTDSTCTVHKMRDTRALIEWPDGHLCTVALERVQFTDREG